MELPFSIPSEDDSIFGEVAIYIVSRGRPGNVPSMEAHLPDVKITWVLEEEEVDAYGDAGATHNIGVKGGTLCKNRNTALEDAFDKNLTCIQLDDDLVSFAWWTLNGFEQVKITAKAAIIRTYNLMLSQNLYLGGSMPTDYIKRSHLPAEPEFQTMHFICASFMVIRPTHLRFNENLKLKEDYDYTVQHIKEYGGILRVRQLLQRFQHYKKVGGTDYRTPEMEQRSIRLVREAHPGWFKKGRNENEIVLFAPGEFRGTKRKAKRGEDETPLSPLTFRDVYEFFVNSPYSWI